MAKIEIFIDTEKKDQSTVSIDGEKLEDITHIYIYDFGHKKYMSVEIAQLERPDEDDGITKRTILTASEKTDNKLVQSNSILTQEEREELTKVVQSLRGKE